MTKKKGAKALAVTLAALGAAEITYAHNEADIQNVVRVAYSALDHAGKEPVRGHSVEQIVRAFLELPPDTKDKAAAVHDAWLDVMAADGWAFGEQYSPEGKTTPSMVPFGDLPERQREYLEVIGAVALDAVHAINVACSNLSEALKGDGPVLMTATTERLPASVAEAQDLIECTDAEQAVPVSDGVRCFKDEDRRTMFVAKHPHMGLVKIDADLLAK